MIEDQELAALFREESEEHLQNLDAGLLRLEREPRDAATLDEVFRAAHSLKGASRMLGLGDVETLAHHFEDVLGSAARGGALLPGTIERLLGALDAVRALVSEALGGAPSGVDLTATLAQLNAAPLGSAPLGSAPLGSAPLGSAPLGSAPLGSAPLGSAPLGIVAESCNIPALFSGAQEPSPAANNGAITEPIVAPSAALPASNGAWSTRDDASGEAASRTRETAPTATVEAKTATVEAKIEAQAAALSAGGAPESAWKIETMRVEPSKLDALLAMAGELIVATTRARRGRGEYEELVALWEEESKAVAARRRAWAELERALEREGAPREASSALRELRRLGAREDERWNAFGALLTRLRAGYEDVARLDGVAGEMEAAIRGVRLLPLATLFALFGRTVRDLAKAQGKDVDFRIEGGEVTADKRILEELKDPLMHMVRNAVDHGLETPTQREAAGKNGRARLVLRAVQTVTRVVVELRDDGRGLDEEAIARAAVRKGIASAEEIAGLSPGAIRELIFAPGFSTSALITDVSGRGVGLDVVRANVEKLRGRIEVESVRGQGTTFRLSLPVTLATTRVLLVRARGHQYALPIESVRSVHLIAPHEAFALRGRPHFAHDGAPVPLASLGDLLRLPAEPGAEKPEQARPCVLLAPGSERLGVWVDEVLDEQEIILKPLGALLDGVPNLAGATILDTGGIALVLHVADLCKGAARAENAPVPAPKTAPPAPKRVLLVEDSITTRTQEKRILESAGYAVTIAVDGLDGWNKLAAGAFDALVSDVEMPNLDGLSLAARVRQNPRYSELPIILVTSLASEADRKRGLDVGANAYLTKGGFDQKALLDTLKRLA